MPGKRKFLQQSHFLAVNLSLFFETYCKVVVDHRPCLVRYTSHMLDITDKLNSKGIKEHDFLVSFDIINMFPSTNYEACIQRVRRKM